MLEIDGSYGEGGGQILRTSVALAALQGRELRVVSIRKNRRRPGLSHQHVTAVRSAAALCGAELEGCHKGSGELVFRPGEIKGGSHSFDVGTAGSLTLVLQTLLPILLRTGGTVELVGGSDVKWAPSFEFFDKVFLPQIRRLGARVELSLLRRGHVPEGGGKLKLEVSPSRLHPLPEPGLSSRGALLSIKGRVHLSQLPDNIAERITRKARTVLWKELSWPGLKHSDIHITTSWEEGNPGCGLTLWAEFENTRLGYGLSGEKGLSSERLAWMVATTLATELRSGATVDEWSSDQIFPYLVCLPLINGDSLPASGFREPGPSPIFFVRKMSQHLRTIIWVLEQFGLQPGQEIGERPRD